MYLWSSSYMVLRRTLPLCYPSPSALCTWNWISHIGLQNPKAQTIPPTVATIAQPIVIGVIGKVLNRGKNIFIYTCISSSICNHYVYIYMLYIHCMGRVWSNVAWANFRERHLYLSQHVYVTTCLANTRSLPGGSTWINLIYDGLVNAQLASQNQYIIAYCLLGLDL